MSKRIGAAVAGAAAALFLTTACGTGGQTTAVDAAAQQQSVVTPVPVQTGGGLDYGAGTTPSAAASNAAPTAAPSAAAVAGTTAPAEATAPISAVDDPALGQILADGKGRTLYRFDKDTAWPMKSNCLRSCLDKWPAAAAVTEEEAQAAGLDPDLISVFTRSDGTEQLSYDCWPLYWFRGDTQAGQTNGHGVDGTWWAVSPDGEKANGGKVADTSDSDSADTGSADSDSGY